MLTRKFACWGHAKPTAAGEAGGAQKGQSKSTELPSGKRGRRLSVGALFGIDSLPQLTDKVEGFRARQLTPAESKAFAESAILLKYDDLQAAPVGPVKLLEARRTEDAGADLWSTYNRVQENIIRGGIKDYSRRKQNGQRHTRTRAVGGLDENVRLNKALWHLAEALRAGNLPTGN